MDEAKPPEVEMAKIEKVEIAESQSLVPLEDTSELAMFFDKALMDQSWRACQLLAASTLIPTHFQKNPSNVFIALQLARRLKLDPFMTMQKLYVVHGKTGFEAQFIIALVNRCGLFRSPITWRMEGKEGSDERSATAIVIRKDTGEILEETCSISLAKREGWMSKEGSKWKTMPELMLKYRSASFLARLHCPEVVMGLPPADELEDHFSARTIEVKTEPPAALPPGLPADPTAEPANPNRPFSQTEQVLGILGADKKTTGE